MIVYEVVRRTVGVLWGLILKVRVEGRENVPRTGPFVVLMNHQSFLDPLLVHSLAPRQVFSMTKSTQFRKPLMRWLLRHLGGFPTRRYQVDPQAVRVALRYLDQGRAVGIYPEGERSWDARLQPLRLGTIRLVLKAGVPVIPVGVVGAYDAWPRWDGLRVGRLLRSRASVTLRFGEPIHLGRHDTRAEREAVLDETLDRIRNALEKVSRP